jgi:LAO/AO transport system kinase
VEHALARRVTAGDAAGIARALTVVENDPEGAAELLEALAGSTGRAHRVGVTGPPGAGKSTLVAALAAVWRAAGRRVGIVAVDPTSPFSGGALLGDRIRMGALAGDAGVFIRSLATRGAVGGLSRAANDACDVLDAAGFDVVAIETVGVGQNEVAVAGTADTVVVVVAPGSGDAVQAMKGGLLEVADVVVVNQGDRTGAEALVSDLAAGIDLREGGEKPPVLRTTATTGEGVVALAAAIDARRAAGADGAALAARRRARAAARIREEADRVRAAAWWEARGDDLERLAGEVAAGRMAVARAVGRLLAGPSPSPGAKDPRGQGGAP